MKIWWVLCFLSLITELNAKPTVDSADNREEKVGVGVISHLDDESHQSSSKDHKAELSSFGKGSSESLMSSKEEKKSEPYIIIGGDKSSPPGGGLPLLDPKVVNELILPPFGEPAAPWWERWWDGATGWLLGGTGSDQQSDAKDQDRF